MMVLSTLGSILLLGIADALVTQPDAPSHNFPLFIDTFPTYMEKFGKTYELGSPEYEVRHGLYLKSLAAVAEHEKAGRSWKAGINAFSDYTDAELGMLRGFSHSPDAPVHVETNLLLKRNKTQIGNFRAVPARFSWKPFLKSLKTVPDQGICGSSWAVSTAAVLSAHSELFHTGERFSAQQILSCTPNPDECGGLGGCMGGSADLAMDSFLRSSVLTEKQFPYTATEEACPNHEKSGTDQLKQVQTAASFGMKGWHRLPENNAKSLLLALYLMGPVAVTVAAGGSWNHYFAGIMDDCAPKFELNHVVTLVGYGSETDKEDAKRYYLLQNSWGNLWGEEGYIRLFRKTDVDDEMKTCDSYDGAGCKAGKQVTACGNCGILYDAVVPEFTLSSHGWWASHGVTPDVE